MVYYVAGECIPKQQIISKFHQFVNDFQINIIYTDEPIRHYNGNISDSGITFIDSSNFNTDIITEYFIEDIRIECKVASMKYSPIEYYNQHREKIDNLFYSTISPDERKNKLSLYYKFRLFINAILLKFCDVFPLYVPMSIYSTFQPRKILDMSAGWGDRLLGAIAYQKADYTGVDPNSKLHPRYRDMISTFAANSSKKYTMIESGFENVELQEKYDMMFSSPPYFIAEEYSQNKNQSFKKYTEIQQWLREFMHVSVDKIWEHLELGGFFIIVINDIKQNKNVIHYTQQIMDYISGKIGAKFVNMLKYKTDETIQPIWVFQKLPSPSKSINSIIQLNNNNKNKNKAIIGGKYLSMCNNFVKKTTKKSIFLIINNLFMNNKNQNISKNISKNRKEFFITIAYICYLYNKKLYIVINNQEQNKNNQIIKDSLIAKIFSGNIIVINFGNFNKSNNILSNIKKMNEFTIFTPEF